MSYQLPSRYDYTEIESRIYAEWEKNNCFRPETKAAKSNNKTFSMVIPPPNVTGRLHMGHALNNTIQDMLIRYKRMDGYASLWIPGTDHAGIATQTVVKKKLDAENIDYRALGREKFVEQVWDWKEKYGGMILNQLKKLGASCDWSRTRFTMDEGLSHAVRKCFKELYDAGLIYRGKRIVNWCPIDRTALSDDEVETKEGGEPGFLWHIRYLLEDGTGEVVVATTRPETLFGDVAVAVHPNDDRYKTLVGKKVKLPLTTKLIPIIADDYVDSAFGTGCLKITPAHDPNDFEVGARHKFEPVNIMNEDATMNELVPEPFQKLSREKCRALAIEKLKAEGLLVKEEPRMTPVGRSYRSKAIIEFRLSEQWFVKMEPLAKKVLEKHKELNIQPERWDKVYLHWLNGIRDWCISRQIWWGHRIPAWYHKTTGEILVSEDTPKEVLANPDQYSQDNDVLDTWFSSALWPMSTLGWPEKTPDFEKYFPTTTLSTAKDIIFFWVARMNIMAVHFTGKLPYTNVFIHPTVMDEKGQTMSKSKGNGIDPLHIINGATKEDLTGPVQDARPSNMKEILARIDKNYPEGFVGVGADAMRYTLIYLCSTGTELRLSLENFIELGRRFTTKFWNAARFTLLSIENAPAAKPGSAKITADEDRWILARLAETSTKVRESLDNYSFSSLGLCYYQFVWNDFCDWYLELNKVRVNSEDQEVRDEALKVMVKVLSDMLRLLHPLVPFITEEIWSKIIPLAKEKNLLDASETPANLLMLDSFPEAKPVDKSDEAIVKRFEVLQNVVGDLRGIRATYQIKEKDLLKATYHSTSPVVDEAVTRLRSTFLRLGYLETLDKVEVKPEHMASVVRPDYTLFIDLSAFVDPNQERERIEKELEKVKIDISVVGKKLSNEGFIKNAKPELVEIEKGRLEKFKAVQSSLEKQLAALVK